MRYRLQHVGASMAFVGRYSPKRAGERMPVSITVRRRRDGRYVAEVRTVDSAVPARPTRPLSEQECATLLASYSIADADPLFDALRHEDSVVVHGWKQRSIASTLVHNALLLYVAVSVALLVVVVLAVLPS